MPKPILNKIKYAVSLLAPLEQLSEACGYEWDEVRAIPEVLAYRVPAAQQRLVTHMGGHQLDPGPRPP